MLKKTILILAFCLGLLGLVLFLTRAHTPAVDAEDGIASLESIRLGGYEQAVLIRGQDSSNPLLLFLHGGPGMPAMYLAHAFQGTLERDFVVVHWDQRGAGKSFRDDLDLGTLTVSRLLSDAAELTDTLRARFSQEKIYLVGHSWGSYLGTLLVLKHPGRFYAFVGVGQVVDQEREDSLQAAFIRKEALARGVPEALEDLEALGTAAHEKWLFRFGGELAGATGWLPLVWTGVLAPEYSLRDVLRVAAGSQVSSRHMVYDVLEGPLGDHVESYPVPVFFFQGRTDWTTPSPLVEEYYQRILAPSKELVWFEHSSHFPFFEEPDRFAQEMRRVKALVEDEKGGT